MVNAFLMVGCLLAGLMLPAISAAGPWIESSKTNVQLLAGQRYELGRRERQIVTLEHATRWRYGDVHFFSDLTLNDDVGAYAELTPRLSFSKLGMFDTDLGPLTDTYLAANVEFGKRGVRRYLYGLGFDLAVPGFASFKLNALHRNNPQLPGSTGQVTLIWKRVFALGATHLVLEGFADFIGAEGPKVASQLVVPRFLVDIGALSGKPNHLYLGMEWQYWHNKFGRRGVTESVPQLQLKYQF